MLRKIVSITLLLLPLASSASTYVCDLEGMGSSFALEVNFSSGRAAVFYNYSQGSGIETLRLVARNSAALDFVGSSRVYEGMRLTAKLKSTFSSVRNNQYGVVTFPLMYEVQTANVINCLSASLDSGI